jgi:hypothetical protein
MLANYSDFNVSSSVTRHDGDFFAAAWETWYAASDRACQVTAWAWGLYREAFFSPAALARYQWLGQMIACLGMLTYLTGKLTRIHLDAWVDSCQAPEPVQDAPEPAPAPVASPEPQPQPEATPLAALGIRELRKLGTVKGVKGAARMKKDQLLASLAA